MIKYVTWLLLLCAIGCSNEQQKKEFKIAATPVPHAEMLEFIKPDLKAQGINLNIIVSEDYQMPNRALAQHEVEANFFQHQPFLEAQIEQFHYPIEGLAKIEIEPLGIYSKKISSLTQLPEKATIALPNDPTNESRALLLLQKQGLLKLDNPLNLQATVLNIVDNPHQYKFIEVDAAMLPRTLEDVDAAAINTNYALEAGLNPLKDAIALEEKDSPYVNVLVIRKEDKDLPEIQALLKAMTSSKMRTFILETYRGAVLPAF